MGSLDNFHTGNGSGKPHWPVLEQRMRSIQQDLHAGNLGDLPNKVPIGPVQPVDGAMRMSARPDPRITERQMFGYGKHFIPTRPYTHRIVGDTADGLYLYSPTCLRNKLVNYAHRLLPIKTTSRFVPY